MESPGSHDVAPAVTSLSSRRDDNNNMTYARRCVVMEIIKAETDYVTHLFDVVQVKTKNTPVVSIHCVSKKTVPPTNNTHTSFISNSHSFANSRHLLINPLEFRGNYNATSNNMKLVHWPLIDGLLNLVQRRRGWAGPQPAQAPPSCTKCNSPPINGQRTNNHIAV